LPEEPLEETLAWLSHGRMEIVGRIVRSWNHVFLARMDDKERTGLAVYKPRAGEYPLWDFPHGTLCLREMAAYRLSLALGWPPIPPTVLRDGPYGFGMVQQFIKANPKADYFTLRQDRLADLLPVALFDHLINNADRKGGHLLVDADGRIWAIDHALTFHEEPKLRTVIWDFAGEPIPTQHLRDLRRLQEEIAGEHPLQQELTRLLSGEEIAALQQRLAALVEMERLPPPDPERVHLPWPLV